MWRTTWLNVNNHTIFLLGCELMGTYDMGEREEAGKGEREGEVVNEDKY